MHLQEILLKFTDVITDRNPANIDKSVITEGLRYDVEALSVLSRFVETAIHVPKDENEIAHIAYSIVKQTFDYWYNKPDIIDDNSLKDLSVSLLRIYRLSFETVPDTQNS